jgi:hypothetical protein
MHITAQKKDFQMLETIYIEAVDSILNNTPPKGVPNASVIPAAAAAASILFLLDVDLFILLK